MKKWKNDSHSHNFQLITPPPPKIWVSTFLSVAVNGKFASAIMKWKNGSNSVKIESRLGMELIHKYLSVERLLHLNVKIEPRFSVYLMGHRSVVLHFLIFSPYSLARRESN